MGAAGGGTELECVVLMVSFYFLGIKDSDHVLNSLNITVLLLINNKNKY